MSSGPGGSGRGSAGGGGPTGRSSTPSTRRSPATAVCVWSSTSVNSAIGSRKRYVRKMKPTIAPAVSPLAGPRATPTTITAATVSTENTSPDGNRKAPMTWARICDSCALLDRLVGRRRRAARRRRRRGIVSAPADDLGDRREHLAVALPRRVVGGDEVALHDAQHERQRGGDGERDEGEHPVVGEHHGADHQHQRAVEQPGQAAPLEELGQRLDVARDAGDERAPALLVVVGEADAVDVGDQAGPQVVQRLLAAPAEPDDGRALGDAGDDAGRRRRSPRARRRSRPARRRRRRCPCRSPAAAGSARRRGRSPRRRRGTTSRRAPGAATGASCEPAVDRVGGAEAPDGLSPPAPPPPPAHDARATSSSARSVSNASTRAR